MSVSSGLNAEEKVRKELEEELGVGTSFGKTDFFDGLTTNGLRKPMIVYVRNRKLEIQ